MRLVGPRSIFATLLFAALVPIALLAALLSSYVINTRLADLDQALTQRGEASARQFASAALLGLFTDDHVLLQGVSQRHLASSDAIARVEVRGPRGEVVAEAWRPGTGRDTTDTTEFAAAVVAPTLQGAPDDGTPPAPLGEVVVAFDAASAAGTAAAIVRNTLLITLLALLLTALVAVVVGRRIVRPLRALHDAVAKVRAGDLSVRVPLASSGEIGDLEAGFNAMADELASSAEQMAEDVAQATADLQQTMDALEIRNIELELARKRALEANAAKSEFLASMSHEIRTPMNGVLGFADLLRRTQLNATQREFVDTITHSANQLLESINDILDFSKMEAGKLVLEAIPFSLWEAIEGCVAPLAPQAHEKRIDMITVIRHEVPDLVVGDPTRLRQILTNLLSNAVKFTAAGEVSLRVAVKERQAERVWLEIAVNDTGIGIPPEQLQGLFEPFNQGAVSTTRLYGGTGLGLSICRRLCDAMDGHIDIASKVGRGSCFSVRLPFSVDPASDAAVRPRQAPRAIAVGVVDPHPLWREALGEALVGGGHAVSYSAAAVADTPTGGEPEVWLLGLSGFPERVEVAAAVGALRRRSAAPICVLLNRGGTGGIELPPGACAVLEKPARHALLLSAVGRCARPSAPAVIEHSDAEAAAGDGLHGRVLVVADDNPVNLQLATALLESFGGTVLGARDGSEALQLVESNRVDMLLVDLHMPGLTGVELAARVHANPATMDLPVLGLTADLGMAQQLNQQRGDFVACLVKPMDVEQLRASVMRALDQKGLGAASPQPVASVRPAPPGDTAAPAVRDRDQAIALVGGSAAIADDLFARFVDGLPDAVDEIAALASSDDWDTLWQRVHRLAGATVMCGVPALHAAVQQLDGDVRRRDPAAVALAVQGLRQQSERVLAGGD